MSILVQALDIGGPGPRVAVKDTIDIAGYATRAGSRALADMPAAVRNADVVQAALDAGCRLIGKANMHELAFGVTGINHATGTASNPFYPTLIPGGSSSGSAAAVAAGLAEFALGTDTGGSIRMPAACCGVYGFKPTFGRVSRRGVLPADSSLDCVGPLARSMDRLIEAMRTIDRSFVKEQRPSMSLALIDVDAVPEISVVIDRAVRDAGLRIKGSTLSGLPAAFGAGLAIINAETWTAFGYLLKTGLLGRDVAERLLRAQMTRRDDIAGAEKIRTAFSAEVDRALENVDALALPTLPCFPPTIEAAAADTSIVRMTALVRPFNLSGHPALTLPVPWSGGFPCGLQVVGRKGDDEHFWGLAKHVANVMSERAVPK